MEFELVALLLLALPLVFTLQKLELLAASGERSHQFTAEPNVYMSSTEPTILWQVFVPCLIAFDDGLDQVDFLMHKLHPLLHVPALDLNDLGVGFQF